MFTTISIALTVMLVCFDVLHYSNFLLVFLVFWSYGLTCILLCIALSICFARTKTAVIIGISIFITSYFASFSIDDSQQVTSMKLGLSLFPSTALSLVLRVIINLEVGKVGLQTEYLGYKYLNFTCAQYFWIITIDIIYLTFACFYLDKIFQGGIGKKEKWYFLFTREYWFNNIKNKEIFKSNKESEYNVNVEQVENYLENQKETGEALVIKSLSKKFAEKIVVQNLDLDAYTGQILALLGHNGAGKSTIISMITGLIEPTFGNAFLGGETITSNLGNSSKISLCPQDNILFPHLSAREHLKLFSVIKNCPQKNAQSEIESIIDELNIKEYSDRPTKVLSGGQKRAVSLAIALLGQAKIILLDEPTAGMDITVRRRMWDVLKIRKKNKIIILTTHYMGEADILADRIAIVNNGRLVCCGSSLFLKSIYNVGYKLAFEKLNEETFEREKLLNFIKEYTEKIKVVSENTKEIIFKLPSEEISKFCEMFYYLDGNLDELNIKGYNLLSCSLEDLFVKIIKINTQKEKTTRKNIEFFNFQPEKQPFFQKLWVQFKILLLKRFKSSIRDKKNLDLKL
ncbi:hypothetical protein SteCoe_7242 [Stentor coeruleus]|uniref:ABC transporter domain-containing protein n=1 Tax=Stentor coeruleus TaxID=5963 RepID=A0A1R2CN32_9CILI|nr:hypothetical protein SteCoe_7242 [Stentor coeruleus]